MIADDPSDRALPARVASTRFLCLLLIGIGLNVPAAFAQSLPDPAMTPGAVATTDAGAVCQPGYAHGVRHVSGHEKHAVYAEYGIRPSPAARYEIDHLVPLELGGSNGPRNLWPQPMVEAREKDRLENRLHDLVCSGQMSLPEAQRTIASDWIEAYRRFLGNPPH